MIIYVRLQCIYIYIIIHVRVIILQYPIHTYECNRYCSSWFGTGLVEIPIPIHHLGLGLDDQPYVGPMISVRVPPTTWATATYILKRNKQCIFADDSPRMCIYIYHIYNVYIIIHIHIMYIYVYSYLYVICLNLLFPSAHRLSPPDGRSPPASMRRQSLDTMFGRFHDFHGMFSYVFHIFEWDLYK